MSRIEIDREQVEQARKAAMEAQDFTLAAYLRDELKAHPATDAWDEAAEQFWDSEWVIEKMAAHFRKVHDKLMRPNDECAWLHYRVITAIRDRRSGGDSVDDLAHDYEIPVCVVEALTEGVKRITLPSAAKLAIAALWPVISAEPKDVAIAEKAIQSVLDGAGCETADPYTDARKLAEAVAAAHVGNGFEGGRVCVDDATEAIQRVLNEGGAACGDTPEDECDVIPRSADAPSSSDRVWSASDEPKTGNDATIETIGERIVREFHALDHDYYDHRCATGKAEDERIAGLIDAEIAEIELREWGALESRDAARADLTTSERQAAGYKASAHEFARWLDEERKKIAKLTEERDKAVLDLNAWCATLSADQERQIDCAPLGLIELVEEFQAARAERERDTRVTYARVLDVDGKMIAYDLAAARKKAEAAQAVVDAAIAWKLGRTTSAGQTASGVLIGAIDAYRALEGGES